MAITRFAGLYGNANALNNPPVAIDPGVLQMDGAITIGQLPIALNNALNLTNFALTDNNAGIANTPDISLNGTTNTTATMNVALSEYLKEVQSFLSTLSVPPVNNSGFLADDSGQSWPLKGTKIVAVVLTYQVITLGLTSLNARVDNISFGGSVAVPAAPVITSLFPNTAQAAGALAVTGAAGIANPMATLTIPMTTQQFDVTPASETYLKLSVVMPNTSVFRLYGIALNINYNYL